MDFPRLVSRWWVAAIALACAACATAPPPPIHPPVSVAFERGLQGHIVLPITVGGVAGYAVLDNGASTSVLDRAFAEEHKLDQGFFTKVVMKAIRGGFEFGDAATLAIGGVTETVTPLVLDTALLSQAAGRDLIGIIGEEFFKRHVVEVNFTRKLITIYDRRAFSPPDDLAALPLKSKSTAKTRMEATIEDEVGHEITFDLGSAGYALVDEGKLADKLLADGRPAAPRSSGIVRNGEFKRHDGKTITSRKITFAGFVLSDIPTDVAAKGFVAPSDISLGVNALSRFDLIFDIGGKRMWMRPNATYANPFPHPVIGVNLAASSKPGAIVVVGIAAGSPAERAGLKRGDVVTRLNGAQAVMDNFTSIKAGDPVVMDLDDGRKVEIVAARFF